LVDAERPDRLVAQGMIRFGMGIVALLIADGDIPEADDEEIHCGIGEMVLDLGQSRHRIAPPFGDVRTAEPLSDQGQIGPTAGGNDS